MDKNGIFRCGVVQMLSIKVPFILDRIVIVPYDMLMCHDFDPGP